MSIISTRFDLDALAGTPEYDSFMAMLAGTLYQLEKDDATGIWKAVENNSVIKRFGFTRADFPDAVAPELPVYVGESVEEQKHKIDAERDTQFNSGFIHNGVLWHCDPIFQSQLQGFILAYSTGVLPLTATVVIRSRDNINHTLSQAQIIVLAGALMAHVQGVYAASWAAKAAL